MLKASLESSPLANQVLLGESKIQEGVKMYRQLREYDNFQDWGYLTKWSFWRSRKGFLRDSQSLHG